MPACSRLGPSLAVALVGLALPSTVFPSDPVGIYGIVEKVVLEPAQGEPERVQLWGVFSLADRKDRDAYQEPVRGVIYASAAPGKEKACRAEWSDFEKLTAKGEPVAFSGRHEKLPRVRPVGEKLEKPDAYPLGFGLSRFRFDSPHEPVRRVRAFPLLKSPEPGSSPPAGKLEIVIQPLEGRVAKDAKLHLEILKANGQKAAEAELEIPKGEIVWKPDVTLATGDSVIWKAWVVEPKWTGPTATAVLEVKKPSA